MRQLLRATWSAHRQERHGREDQGGHIFCARHGRRIGKNGTGTRTYSGAGTYGHVEKIKVGGAVPANDCCYGSKTVNQNESDEKIKVGGAVPANDCCCGSKTVNQYTQLQDRQPEHAAPRPQPEQESLVCTGQ